MALLYGYLHSAVWKDLQDFKVKRAQEARDNQFLFQNVQNNEIFEILKMSKSNRQQLNGSLLNRKQTFVVLGLVVLFSTGNTFFG